MINFILGLVIGGVVVYFFMLMGKKPSEVVVADEDRQRKRENLAKVEAYIANKERFTNDDIEKLLGVSNTTTKRYLDDFEADGKIVQHGDTGSGVYYTKK